MYDLTKLKKDDEYYTPKHAWENIKDYIPIDKVIWEAFYGDGKSGEFLTELGFNVIHKHIDFFDDETLPEYDIIISNPPFNISKPIMNRLLKLDKPFILIMPVSKINTNYMKENFKNKLQIIIPKNRINFIKNEKLTKGCTFDCFYYCYKMNLKNDITWLE